jgi:hypothetical protein
MNTVYTPERLSDLDEEHISLCETLDRVLNKGVVVAGEVVISVANIDLIYLGLQLVLTSVETARGLRAEGWKTRVPPEERKHERAH